MKNKRFINNFLNQHFLYPYIEKILIIACDYSMIDKYTLVRILNLSKYRTITCEICKLPLNYGKKKRWGTIDHKIPKSKGGTYNIKNLQVAHKNVI